MEAGDAPFRFIAPGRTYRCDSDQTHTPMFHQVEGLVIDETTHLGHLKWTLEAFLAAFFEVDNVAIRLRPSYFPFTEPSMEIDMQCHRDGARLVVGEGVDWMEIGGSGMVHPAVLNYAGIDATRLQGFAFGMGPDRLAMLKYGMPDLRAFFDADLRWLKQYGFLPLDVPGLTACPTGNGRTTGGGNEIYPVALTGLAADQRLAGTHCRDIDAGRAGSGRFARPGCRLCRF